MLRVMPPELIISSLQLKAFTDMLDRLIDTPGQFVLLYVPAESGNFPLTTAQNKCINRCVAVAN
jgi:hypothetical protein